MGWKHEDVKKYIEIESNTNYILLSKVYEGTHKKMIFNCDFGHKFEMSFSNFKDHNYRCPECEEIKRKKNRFDLFKIVLEKEGYKLSFTWEDCVTKKTRLNTICPNNHIYKTSYDCFIRGVRCKQCDSIKSSERQRRPLEEVIRDIEIHDFKIIKWIDSYTNGNSKFIVSCNNGHKFESSYSNLLISEFGCSECSGVKKHDGEYVRNCFLERGFTPLFESKDYINANSNLPYICGKHQGAGVQYKNYSNLIKGEECKYCGIEKSSQNQKMDENHVFEFMKNKNMIPLEEEKYIDNHTHIQYICENHKDKGVQTTTWMNLNDGKGCRYCAYESIKGENHYNYKGGITPLHNLVRDSMMKSNWKYESSKIYNGKCALTSLYGKLVVHHKNKNFSEILIEALDMLKLETYYEINKYSELDLINIKEKVLELHHHYGFGILIKENIHKIYHREYGRINNNNEQFQEFTERYYIGEFDDELEEDFKSYNSIKRIKQNKINIKLEEAI